MTHYVGIYGTRYSDEEPLYLTTEQGVRVWDRVKNRWLNWESLVDKAADEGHTWQPREVGIPSIKWQLANSLAWGQRWAPGLDSTNGMPSEAIVNGEDWTGASVGSATTTPPDNWTSGQGTETYQNFTGVLGIQFDAITGGSMGQAVTAFSGQVFVVEISVHKDTTPGCMVNIDGLRLPLNPPTLDGDEFKLVSFSGVSPGTFNISFEGAGGSYLAMSYVRCYLESELTGNG